LDMVVDTAPMAVPLLAMVNRGANPNHTKYEWMMDYTGAYPTSTSGLVRGEGDDADPAATDNRTRLYNYTHIWGKAWSVSHTAEIVDHIGINSEFDYQAAKAARKVVRDFNYLLMNSTPVAEAGSPNASGDPRKMGGLIDQIKNTGRDWNYAQTSTNAYSGLDYVSAEGQIDGVNAKLVDDWKGYWLAGDGSSNGASNNASATAPITSALLHTALQTMWQRGGLGNGALQVLANGDLRKKLSDLYAPESGSSGIHRREFGSSASTEVVLPVDVVVTDFGELHLHLDQSVPTDTILGFDPEWFELRPLRDFEVIELAKTGPSKHGMIEAELGCALLAPNTAFVLDQMTVS